jgi:hypothetical protein
VTKAALEKKTRKYKHGRNNFLRNCSVSPIISKVV